MIEIKNALSRWNRLKSNFRAYVDSANSLQGSLIRAKKQSTLFPRINQDPIAVYLFLLSYIGLKQFERVETWR